MSNTTESNTPQTPQDTNTAQVEGAPTLPKDELKEKIKNQIEFYFSSQNLPSDTFLLSKMDEDQFVPVTLIASFGKIKALTSDHEVVVESIVDSKYLELSSDKSKLRPKEEKKRNRIILHNLPPQTTTEEVKEIFSQGNFSPEINPDVNNCWFISFETEEKATSALEFIRQQKIHDKTIRARLKPETSLRTLYSRPVPYTATYLFQPPYAAVPPMYWSNDNFQRNFDGKDPYNRRSNPKKGPRKDNRKGFEGKKRQGPNRKNKRGKQTATELGPSDFPPLPSAHNTKNTGYSSNAFTKYTQEEIASSLKNMEPQKPADLGDEFPVLQEPIRGLEADNPSVIEAADLPAQATPLPLSERVKKSSPATSNPGKSKNKVPAKESKAGKQKTPKPKPVKTSQEKTKGSWSQIAKAGDQKSKSSATNSGTPPTEKSPPASK